MRYALNHLPYSGDSDPEIRLCLKSPVRLGETLKASFSCRDLSGSVCRARHRHRVFRSRSRARARLPSHFAEHRNDPDEQPSGQGRSIAGESKKTNHVNDCTTFHR